MSVSDVTSTALEKLSDVMLDKTSGVFDILLSGVQNSLMLYTVLRVRLIAGLVSNAEHPAQNLFSSAVGNFYAPNSKRKLQPY